MKIAKNLTPVIDGLKVDHFGGNAPVVPMTVDYSE